ncbi:hypothetical protein [Deinococcus marmoris]|uniref:Uncharacterized protein n=1 Tax=Deinococcus marmoris TaxID=249408 RepID=A0A1U7P4U1_9DEIO|nr:hypothetical protein [Deinococcus marmoris]OLV20179.1 hypothetical protein BOO71_0000565 [Deinococcus marmoris]
MSEKAPPLTHDTIGELEAGGIGYAINAAIEEMMADCSRRPGLEKARTVTITLKFKPRASTLDQGRAGLNSVGVLADVKTSSPPRASSGEFLNVAESIGADGKPVIQATFAQMPLLRAGSN